MLKDAFNDALGFFGIWFGIQYGYMWSKVLLSLWIEDNEKADTISGRIIAFLFCLAGSGLIGGLFYLMFKTQHAGLVVFMIIFPCSLIAAYKNYYPDKQ